MLTKIFKNKTILASLLMVTVYTGCALSTNKIKEEKTNKQKVIELLSSIQTGDSAPIAYINEKKYIQHNLAVKDGLAGFAEVMTLLPKGSTKAKVIRAYEDNNFVFAHTKYDFFGPKAGFDIFRFENGKIVEHWDNLQATVEKTASGRSMFDGETQVRDLDKTDENKELVKNFLNDILFGKAPNKISQYISTSTYYQHNPYVKDGLKGLNEAITYLVSINDMFVYKQTHKILGQGNFVLSVNQGEWHGKVHSFYDLFRIEKGKIVEHWDTIEEVLAKEKWQNNNGKF